jgi:predicted MPP superfamily phosphohydrolase
MNLNKLAWLTDTHLNFLDSEDRSLFYQEIVNSNCDAVLISGDIAEAPSIVNILREMEAQIQKNIYFVLGNHDYYRGNVDSVRETMTALTNKHEHLFWLPAAGLQKLNADTILLGQDGWADGRLGDYQNSRVVLNDSRLIMDLFQANTLGKYKLLEKMQQLADDDAKLLQWNLTEATQLNPKKIIVVTHVPPFKEACQYNGMISDDYWLPFFSSKATGDILTECAVNHPSIEFLVLCGHTHGKADFSPLNNLIVKTGHAEYGEPEIQECIKFN